MSLPELAHRALRAQHMRDYLRKHHDVNETAKNLLPEKDRAELGETPVETHKQVIDWMNRQGH